MTERERIAGGAIQEALGIGRVPDDETPCVVSHEDAGGPCVETVAFTVYGLPFCTRHGTEAKAGAIEEMLEEMEQELEILAGAERERHMTNDALANALEAAYWGRHNHGYYVDLHDKAVREAYPPIAGRADPTTTAFEYGEARISPVDWWIRNRWLLCKFMRMAYSDGDQGVVAMLEPLREHAAAQQVHAEDDYERKRASQQ